MFIWHIVLVWSSTIFDPLTKDFSAFVTRFPISVDCQPPSKKQRVEKAFLATVCFMTGGEAPSMPRDRNICCVSTPLHNTALTIHHSN